MKRIGDWITLLLKQGDEYHEANSCRRKVRYSKQSAIASAIRMKEKTGEEFDAYECQYCKGWHIGHSWQPIKISLESGK